MRPLRRIVNPNQKKVLVLMSNTGGGHKASAEAIEAGFKQLYGDKCAPQRNCVIYVFDAVLRADSVHSAAYSDGNGA